MAPVAPVSVVHGSSLLYLSSCLSCGSSGIICCRSCVQYYTMSVMAPGCRSWLQYVSSVAPVLSSSPPVASGSIGCRLWLQYLSLLAPVVVVVPVVCGSPVAPQYDLSPVASVSVVCCLVLWLQYYLLSFDRLWLSSICISSRLWLQSPVSPVIHGSSSICISCHLSHHLVAPPVAVVCGSSLVQYLSSRLVTPVDGCRLWLWYLLLSWLRYLLSILSCGSRLQAVSVHRSWLHWLLPVVMAPVAPVSVVGVSSTTICCLWLL